MTFHPTMILTAAVAISIGGCCVSCTGAYHRTAAGDVAWYGSVATRNKGIENGPIKIGETDEATGAQIVTTGAVTGIGILDLGKTTRLGLSETAKTTRHLNNNATKVDLGEQAVQQHGMDTKLSEKALELTPR